MPFAIPDFQLQRAPVPAAIVSTVLPGDVTWDRPIFKAPPIKIVPPAFDAKAVAEELRRGIRPER